jgi:putative MATE family efflux protein
LIFGIWIFPEMGIRGAAWGSSLGRLVGTLLGIFVILRGTADIRLYRHNITWKIDGSVIKSILKIGIPASLEQLVRQSSMIIYTSLVAGLGTAALAANAIAMNINSLSFMPGFGFGTAATTLVGQSLGAKQKDLADAYGKQTALITFFIMSAASVLMYIWIVPIVRLYTDDLEVIALASSALRIFVFFQPLLSLFMVLAGALRGAGDTKWVLYITLMGNWGFRLIASLIFAFVLDLGLNGFWLGMGVDLVLRSILISWRYRSKKWQNIRVISRERKPNHA